MKNVVCISIKQKETGSRIRKLMHEQGYSVKDIQEIMGFETPRAVYKWLSGDTLPTVDNLLILCRVLHTNMEKILVYDGDFSLFARIMTGMQIWGYALEQGAQAVWTTYHLWIWKV